MATKSTTKKTAPKKETEAVKEVTVEATKPVAVETPVADENAMLKEQMAKMQAQMELMAQMMANNGIKPEPEASSNRMIRFVSLKDTTIVLKGSSFWDIEGRFAYRDFPEKEARLIALNMANYLRQGSVYIDDAQFVKDNDLDYIYATLLSDTELKELLNTSAANVIETYKNVNDNQKEIIIDMIIADKKAGKKIDSNILVELGELSGRNLVNLEDEDEE